MGGLLGQTARVGAGGEPSFGDSVAGAVVEENAVFRACPDGVVFQETRALNLEEEPARFAPAGDDGLLQRSLRNIELVVTAKDEKNMAAKFIQGG